MYKKMVPQQVQETAPCMLISLLKSQAAQIFFSCFMLIERSSPAAGTQRLPRLVGLKKALEMMLVWLICTLQVAMHAQLFSLC